MATAALETEGKDATVPRQQAQLLAFEHWQLLQVSPLLMPLMADTC